MNDTIGADFDLAGLDTIKLTVGGVDIPGTVDEESNTVTFDDGHYVVTYNPNASAGETLTWEIKQYYPREFRAAERVVELLEDEWGLALNVDETASIALHMVNAEENGVSIHQSMDQIHLMDQVMQIIRYQAHLAPREDDLDYQRLVVHVRFFVQRVMGGRHAAEPSPLYEMVRQSYPEAYAVAERVRSFVEGKIRRVITDDEITYLIIHIARLLRNQQSTC